LDSVRRGEEEGEERKRERRGRGRGKRLWRLLDEREGEFLIAATLLVL
jgi:hypothetical protein